MSQPTLAKRLTFTKDDEQFLDSIITEYGNLSSVEIKKRSYATTPMQGCTIGGEEKFGEIVF
ncbi:MAG: hypothetical protein LBG59_05260 [Candidatus Peribacteria bacterium]|nr:hypothetical protein [Candidatus Peribacteria bacterium]